MFVGFRIVDSFGVCQAGDFCLNWRRFSVGAWATPSSEFEKDYQWYFTIFNMESSVTSTKPLSTAWTTHTEQQDVQESKPKKNICCACPDTKRLRDECIAEHGPDNCTKWIDVHRQCLRAEGFKV
eukprot:c20042_g1_i1 orf=341-715(-)